MMTTATAIRLLGIFFSFVFPLLCERLLSSSRLQRVALKLLHECLSVDGCSAESARLFSANNL